jgi:hypothetical protein
MKNIKILCALFVLLASPLVRGTEAGDAGNFGDCEKKLPNGAIDENVKSPKGKEVKSGDSRTEST